MKKGDIVRVKAVIFTGYENPVRYIANKNAMGIATKSQNLFELVHSLKVVDLSSKAFSLPYHTRCKSLFREIIPSKHTFLGILIGKTYLATGHKSSSSYDEPTTFCEDKRHPCWKVEPILKNDRYLQPVLCLEEDLEMVAELNISHLLLMSGLLK